MIHPDLLLHNLGEYAYDPDSIVYNLNNDLKKVIVPNADPYGWDHVFQADDFDGILAYVQEIVGSVVVAGAVLYEIRSVAPDGSTVISQVLLTPDGTIEIVGVFSQIMEE